MTEQTPREIAHYWTVLCENENSHTWQCKSLAAAITVAVEAALKEERKGPVIHRTHHKEELRIAVDTETERVIQQLAEYKNTRITEAMLKNFAFIIRAKP